MKINIEDVKIPPIPTVMIQVMLFDPSHKDASSYSLEKMITPDKAICAELLRISNSSYYGRSGSIKNLKDAITLLGLKTTKNIVILLSSKSLRSQFKGELFGKYLEEWSLLSALTGYDLAPQLRLGAIKEDIFLSCLMQKIGMTVFALNFKDKYLEVLKRFEAKEKDLVLIEREVFETDHIEIGERVFKYWKMPPTLTESIEKQGFGIEDISKVSDITKVSVLSSIIAKKLMGIFENENDKVLEESIFLSYKSEEKLKAAFGDSYYELLKSHPFFELAA